MHSLNLICSKVIAVVPGGKEGERWKDEEKKERREREGRKQVRFCFQPSDLWTPGGGTGIPLLIGVTSRLAHLVPGPSPGPESAALGRGWSLEGAAWRRRSLGPRDSGLGAGVGLGGRRGLWLRGGGQALSAALEHHTRAPTGRRGLGAPRGVGDAMLHTPFLVVVGGLWRPWPRVTK